MAKNEKHPDPSRSFNQRVYALVRRIPKGKVTSYGQIALWLEMPSGARAVGWALNALNMAADSVEADVPWQRVVNAQRQISNRSTPYAAVLQRAILEEEGVRFKEDTIEAAHMIQDESQLLPA
jgi:methylated-DNA-protein-cysteine methyltransferase related protein